MKREQLEHVLRAASDIVAFADLLVIGSQSVLATWDDRRLPRAAIRSMEADVATLDGDEAKSDLIDGNMGEGSRFHETYGFYAQGVSLKTAVLPTGWRDRLVVLANERTKPGRGLCLDPYDLDVLGKRVVLLEIDSAMRSGIVAWLEGQRKLGAAR